MDNLVKLNLDFDELDDFNFIVDEPFSLEVNFNKIKYNFIIKFSSNNKNLICCGAGAHARDTKDKLGKLIKPPYIDRWSWYKYFEESFIAFSDPIFYYDDEITLGWYVGEKDQWYLEVISLIIQKLAKNQKIQSNNILFFASSGGGFASIGLATLIKGSFCLVNNAQFFCLNFNDFHINNLFRFLKKKFVGLSESEIINFINYRLNLIELFKKENYMPSITYYVNVCSKSDITKQAIPFLEEVMFIPQFKNNLDVHFYNENKDNPHHPMSIDKTLRILKNFINKNLNNSVYQNKIVIGDLIFDIPNGFIKTSEREIKNSSLGLCFDFEDSTNIYDVVNKYKLYYNNKDIMVISESLRINTIEVVKVKVINSNTVRYLFVFGNKLYQIYSFSYNESTDDIVESLVSSITM